MLGRSMFERGVIVRVLEAMTPWRQRGVGSLAGGVQCTYIKVGVTELSLEKALVK